MRPAPKGSLVRSDIQVLYIERVLLDELAPWLDLVAHQPREPEIRRGCVFHVYTDQHPPGRIHRRRPELARVHLAETLEPGDLQTALRQPQRSIAEALERQCSLCQLPKLE